ncbi:MAG: polysaccharide biosynthesis protein PslG [Acidobacteriota bacterium]|jgi:hypothetical protein|nr:polysaccharide biosynthesis protein PslG [Acidobacteriota bacterium]
MKEKSNTPAGMFLLLAVLFVPSAASAQILMCKKPNTPTDDKGALILANPPAAPSVAVPLDPPVVGQPLYDRDAHGHLPIGFNDGAIQGSLASAPTVARITRDMNGVLVRENFEWKEVERNPGCYQWNEYDGYYHFFIAHGVRPIWILVGTPRWANLTATSLYFPPNDSHVANYAAMAAAIAKRYPLSAGIEVWNEPNLKQYWSNPDPSLYDHLLTATYDAVKAANPAMRVLGGVLSVSGDDTKSYGYKPETFLEAMLKDPIYGGTILQKMDALSLHPYPFTEPDEEGLSNSFPPMFAKIDRVLEEADEPMPRLVIDELGASLKRGFTEKTQCTTLVTHFNQLDQADPRIALSGQVDAVLFDVDVEGSDGYGFGTISSTSSTYTYTPRYVYGELRTALTGPTAPDPEDCATSDRTPRVYPKP